MDKHRQIIYWKKVDKRHLFLIIHWKKLDKRRHFQKTCTGKKQKYFAILNRSPTKQHTIPADVLPNDSEELYIDFSCFMHSRNSKDIKLFYMNISVVLSSVKRQRILSFLHKDFSCFIISKNTKDVNFFLYQISDVLSSVKIKKMSICFTKGFFVGFLLRGFLVLKGIVWFLEMDFLGF